MEETTTGMQDDTTELTDITNISYTLKALSWLTDFYLNAEHGIDPAQLQRLTIREAEVLVQKVETAIVEVGRALLR